MSRITLAIPATVMLASLVSVASAELIAHFKFDEGSGFVAHNSAGSVNGDIRNYNGATTGGWVAGAPGFGNAYNFNGTDSTDVPLAALAGLDQAGANPTKVTVAYWKKGNDLPNDASYPYAEDFMVRGMWLHSWASWNPYLGNGLVYQSANAGMGFSDQMGGAAPADSLNEWHHYALAKDAETGLMKTYIDGNIVGNGFGFTKKFSAPIKFDIGSHGGELSFRGAIDDFRMYNTALTDDEIFDLMTPPEPSDDNADFDGNNVVDGADFLRWQWGMGDADGDSDADGDDLAIWKAQFGGPPPSISADAGAIPEPTSFAVFAWGIAGLAARSRRRRLAVASRRI